MIKKILLTLLILIVIVIAGIVALVVFVDPNNFRGFISEKVKDKTGYELTIEGDLRWHVWPQISILTDSVRLEDEGAQKPILTADNMRLDVELFPLFSKELVVKNVLIKSAVINITDESKGKVASGEKPRTTVNQTVTEPSQNNHSGAGWSFTLNKLDIADSTIVYQQNKETINFRDINASITQKDDKNVAVDLKGSINRDQQDFIYSLNADVNLMNFPESANIELHKLTYEYKSVGAPSSLLQGEVSATFNYQKTPLVLDSKNFVMTLNDNKIEGKLKANLAKKPYFEALFTADKFNLTPFIESKSENKNEKSNKPAQNSPVVTTKVTQSNELAFLNNFDAKFNIIVKEATVNNVVMTNFIVDADNKDGIATLNKVNLDVANGHIIANGIANGKQSTTSVKLTSKISNIDLGALFTQLELAYNFKGQLNAQGDIAANTINPKAIMTALTGELNVVVNNARFENFNIQKIIQSAVSKYSKESITADEYQKYTELNKLSANAKLSGGNLNLSSIKAESATLDVSGDGRVGLMKKDLDINMQVKILSGWNGESKTIQKLQKLEIPLRVYGTFDALHYQVDADKLLKDALNDKLQNEIDRLKDRINGNKKNSKDSDQSDTLSTDDASDNSKKDEAKEILGGILNKIKKKNN